MPIIFRCDHCRQRMSITRKRAGQMTTCPNCQQETIVPESKTQKESPAPADVPVPAEDVLPESSPQAARVNEDVPEDMAAADEFPAGEDPLPQLAAVAEADEDSEEDEFTLRRAKTEFEEMDLTPMVDVTFLLLIFFMVTASFSIEKSLEVPTPDPDQEGASQTVQPLEELEDQSILVEIDAENRFFVETEPIDDPRDLAQRLIEIRTSDSKNEVVIKVDAESHHEAIVSAIDAAQEVGMQRIRWGVTSTN